MALGLGVAWHLDEAAAALKLGMGRHGRGQLVFMVGKYLERTPRRSQCRGGGGFSRRRSPGRKKTTDRRGLANSETRRERGGAGDTAAGPACGMGRRESGPRDDGDKANMGCGGSGSWAARAKSREGKRMDKIPFLFFLTYF